MKNVCMISIWLPILATGCAAQAPDKLGDKQSLLEEYCDYCGGEGDPGDYYYDNGDGYYDENGDGYYDTGDPGDEDDDESDGVSNNDTGSRTCPDGLILEKQDSNQQPASFTTVGQAELAHCIQSQYNRATFGENLTITSGTRNDYQQAFSMFTGPYRTGGCAEITRLYQGRGRARLVSQMCAQAVANNYDQVQTIAQWTPIVAQARTSGVPFSLHEDGAGIDIRIRGVNETELNDAIAICGGTRNAEGNHAHVAMDANASKAPLEGDSCVPQP